jgi:hypothetical protein
VPGQRKSAFRVRGPMDEPSRCRAARALPPRSLTCRDKVEFRCGSGPLGVRNKAFRKKVRHLAWAFTAISESCCQICLRVELVDGSAWTLGEAIPPLSVTLSAYQAGHIPMTYSLIGAERTTHLKIMLVALIAAGTSVTAIGAAARPNGETLRDRLRMPAGVLAVASEGRSLKPMFRAEPCPEPCNRGSLLVEFD